MNTYEKFRILENELMKIEIEERSNSMERPCTLIHFQNLKDGQSWTVDVGNIKAEVFKQAFILEFSTSVKIKQIMSDVQKILKAVVK